MDRLKLWLWYWLFFLPGCPNIGRIEDADCLYIQAFGRSMYTDQELQGLTWLCRESSMTDDEKFIELKARGFTPGESNLELAFAGRELVQDRKLMAFMQWEVAYALWAEYPQWYAKHRDFLIALWPSVAVSYFPTVEVKRQSREMARAHGKNRPMELANSWMIVRGALIVAKLEGQLPIVRDMNLLMIDPSSIQGWTRAWWRWLPREFAGRCLHILKRWV